MFTILYLRHNRAICHRPFVQIARAVLVLGLVLMVGSGLRLALGLGLVLGLGLGFRVSLV